MRRTGFRTAMLVVVVAALVGIGYQVWTSASATRRRPGRSLGIELPRDVAQHMRDFRRVKMKDGKPVWEVRAEEARYFDDRDEIIVREPRLVVFLDDGERQAELAGAQGRLKLDEQELESVTFEGDVRLALDDLRLETEVASYEQGRDLIVAPGPVTIRGRSLDVQARGMEVEIEPRNLRLLSDVRTVMRFDAPSS